MKVAHFSLWSPYRSGLFEFVRDQIKYEKRHGVDSILINNDVENPDPNRFQDVGLIAAPWSEAESADLWVLHRSIPTKLLSAFPKKKKIAILHGTSEILVLHEIESGGKNDKFNMHLEFMDRFNKVVAITKEDYAVMKLYDVGYKVIYINDAVDLERFSCEGLGYEFHYRPAIISTANIRINKNPAPLIWAMPEVVRRIPTARLNIFGLNLPEIDTWKRIVLGSNSIATAIENTHCHFIDLRPFLRGADISFNSNYNGIFSRDSMEAMACGCSVVAYTTEHTKYACHRNIQSIADALEQAWRDLKADPEGQIIRNRKYAEANFNMEVAVRDHYIPLYQSMLSA